MKVGDIVNINTAFMEELANVLGFIYEDYTLESGWKGLGVITCNGTDLGGFSEDEQKQYLEYVKDSSYKYEYTTSWKLAKDFPTLIKPLF